MLYYFYKTINVLSFGYLFNDDLEDSISDSIKSKNNDTLIIIDLPPKKVIPHFDSYVDELKYVIDCRNKRINLSYTL